MPEAFVGMAGILVETVAGIAEAAAKQAQIAEEHIQVEAYDA